MTVQKGLQGGISLGDCTTSLVKKKKGAKKGSTASKFRNENEVIPVWYTLLPPHQHTTTPQTQILQQILLPILTELPWKLQVPMRQQARLLRCWEQRSGRLVFLSAGLIMQNYKHLQLMQTNPGKTKPLLLQQNSARIYSQRRSGAPSIACWPFHVCKAFLPCRFVLHSWLPTLSTAGHQKLVPHRYDQNPFQCIAPTLRNRKGAAQPTSWKAATNSGQNEASNKTVKQTAESSDYFTSCKLAFPETSEPTGTWQTKRTVYSCTDQCVDLWSWVGSWTATVKIESVDRRRSAPSGTAAFVFRIFFFFCIISAVHCIWINSNSFRFRFHHTIFKQLLHARFPSSLGRTRTNMRGEKTNRCGSTWLSRW